MECRAGPTPSSPGGPDSLGAEVIGRQAGIVYLQHQARVVHGGRQDLGETTHSVGRHLGSPKSALQQPSYSILESGPEWEGPCGLLLL